MQKDLAPIVIFVYDRPEHTRQTIEALLKNPEAEYSHLFIFSDGPKEGADLLEIDKIIQVRNYIHSLNGFKDITINESSCNLGLATSTIRGVSEVINEYGKIIMLEDDDVPSPFFLSYVNNCLTKYENDDSIWCVSGYTDTDILPPTKGDDVFLVNRAASWGFGTWKRCWDKVIWDIESLKGIFSHLDVIDGFGKWNGIDMPQFMFLLFQDKVSSWSVRFNFASYLNKSYTILPNKSLIINIGQDGTGTHSGIARKTIQIMDRPIILPEIIRFHKIKNRLLLESHVHNSFVKWVLYKLGVLIRLCVLFRVYSYKIYPVLSKNRQVKYCE